MLRAIVVLVHLAVSQSFCHQLMIVRVLVISRVVSTSLGESYAALRHKMTLRKEPVTVHGNAINSIIDRLVDKMVNHAGYADMDATTLQKVNQHLAKEHMAKPTNPPEMQAQARKLAEAPPDPPVEELKIGSNLPAPDPRQHMNVVFIGHVDAGKSTTCGQILYLSGSIDERVIDEYKREAKNKNRESWFLAYIMDTNEEEKAKGKTVEVGRANFETPSKRFTILDAPGHKAYVPNMISGASQSDIGVLIISARQGEFEAGFDKGGQTREHVLLAKTLGIDKIIVAINKMDEPSVEWKQERYNEIKDKLTPFLKQSGFKEEQLIFLPMSGMTGDNVQERKGTPAWYSGKPLLTVLDEIDCAGRNKDAALRIPTLEGFRDEGKIMAVGKIEQGTVRPGMKCMCMPANVECTVQAVYVNKEEVSHACVGENVFLKMHGIDEEQLTKGSVLCDVKNQVRSVSKIKAQLQIVELPEERPVLTAGFQAILHVHTAREECEIVRLLERINVQKKTKEPNPKFAREGWVVTCMLKFAKEMPVDTFAGCSQLGRFTLRDGPKTIAVGKITELPKPT
eukprot:gnl/MRDRNA2_/MRDRNA2_70927_c0_seq1.p1 gnl/MRDRNA2_/MRDRNA2_70927_c0~~gnl/MRDRNA2_/MRDRNA2_70927_c0_seq1.p1  ORF type:complete len:568 (+),score=132.99 gnl/MRDRNA2_/MRDRNA2_70927_c0_seq1:59-1762(+)